jgi:hypothetical protein
MGNRTIVGSIILTLILSICSIYSYGQRIDTKASPFQINGSLGGNLSYYNMDGITERRQPLGYSLFGSVNIRIYGWAFPFSIAVSQQSSSFSQPFARYGVSPEYKWAKLHAGYRNIRFSEFTLNEVSFLGGGVELTPGKFRFSAMYGRLRKGIEQPANRFELPQYERFGYGVKVGYGKKTYIDLSLFTAQDNVNSISIPDSVPRRNPPEAGTSLGLSGRISLVDQKLFLDYDLGLSVFTRDLRVDKLDDSELMANKLVQNLNVNASTNAAYAGSAGLQYKHKIYTTGIKYRYVQAGYRSLGANYLLSDLQMITVNAGAQLLKNQLSVNGSFGVQEDNLAKKKFSRSTRYIGSAQVSYRATDRLNFNMSYSNFSINQTVLKDSLFADSLVIDQTNHLVNLGTSYLIINEKHTHSYTLNTSFQDLSDKRPDPIYDGGNQLISFIFNYGLRFNEKGYGFTIGANYQDFSSLLTALKRYGLNAGINWRSSNKKTNLRLKQVWNRSVLAQYNDDIYTTMLTLSYDLANKHAISANAGLVSRRGKLPFNEINFGIGYRVRF